MLSGITQSGPSGDAICTGITCARKFCKGLRDDLNPPERGFQWCVLKLGTLLLPFVSYAGRYVVWYLGWQPSGFFGAKFNIRT